MCLTQAGVKKGEAKNHAHHICYKRGQDGIVNEIAMEGQEIVKQTDYSCGTLLHQVASEGTPEMIEYLVGKGSDINRIERSWSPLISAIVRSRTDNVKKLIELGARIDNEISESNPLNYAISNNNKEIILPYIYEKYLGKISKYYNESDLQKKIYDGKIRIISDLDDFDIAVIMPDENRDYITLATLGMSSIATAEMLWLLFL